MLGREGLSPPSLDRLCYTGYIIAKGAPLCQNKRCNKKSNVYWPGSRRGALPVSYTHLVDGDTSTNDTVLLLASGLSGAEIVDGTPDYDTFVAALTEAAEHLSRELAGDGEGATKLLECTVTGAPDLATARAVSKLSLIHI